MLRWGERGVSVCQECALLCMGTRVCVRVGVDRYVRAGVMGTSDSEEREVQGSGGEGELFV
jgi:hypothetical protein